MRFERSGGILLHPTSLPGRYGIGDLGPEAYRFADWLAGANQKIWQVLPLGPTGYGDSPYQCFSAFAGNPLLIDLEELAREGYLSRRDLEAAPEFPEDEVEYGRVAEFKLPLIHKAAHMFEETAGEAARDDYRDFTSRHAGWLEDFALFMAAKGARGGAIWTRWEPDLRRREPAALARCAEELRGEIGAQKFTQFVFFRQWERLRDYCHELGIRLMGDIPIYVAHDSADVWANPELFLLDENGEPSAVAGVPPDYFSATGQLWGNPLYNWETIARRGYGWWIDRFQAALGLVDMARLDHFRGFEAYWRVPAGDATAMNGEWVKGPGGELFEAVQSVMGELPIVAENLGVITPEVEGLRRRFNFPGMAILQFAFGNDPQAPSFRPHNYVRNLVAYTGTHDNDTAAGWWNPAAGASTRTEEDVRKEHEFARRYLDLDGREINWVMIRGVLASVADAAIYPLQDVLGLGSEARMNVPGRPAGNWRWRFRSGILTEALRDRLGELTVTYDR
jgi:4-alpha-glucanotransferase